MVNTIVRTFITVVGLTLFAFGETALAQDDHGDTPETATPIGLNATLLAQLEMANDIDFYRLEVVEAGHLRVESSNSVDLLGVLFERDEEADGESALVPLLIADDTGNNLNFLFQIALEPGTYFLGVGYAGLGNLGSYRLTFEFLPGHDGFADDHGDTFELATLIELDGTVIGTNESPDDIDLFRVEVTERGFLTARTLRPRNPAGFVERSDTTGVLFNEDGDPIAFNDEDMFVSLGLDVLAPSAADGTFEFTVEVAPGTYFIGVGSFGIRVDNYVLEVGFGQASPADDHGGTIASATVVDEPRDRLGANEFIERCRGTDDEQADPDCPDNVLLDQSGRLETPGDRDTFRIELPQRGVLTVATVSFNDTFGTLQNARGEVIASNDDDSLLNDFLIERELEAGVYYVEVSGSGGIGTGPYYLDIAFRSTPGAITDDIIVRLEEPRMQSGEVNSGVANIRGWVVSPVPIRRVELFIDGLFSGLVPYGGSRDDVGNEYPQLPNAANSGFSMAFLYGLLSEEETHSIGVKAIDENGDFNQASAEFEVTAFDEFVFRGLVDLSTAEVQVTGPQAVVVRDMVVGAGRYEAMLSFRAATQGFSITAITRTGSVARIRAAAAKRTGQPRAVNEGILVNIEEPIANSTYQGVSNIRGWAVGPSGIGRIEYFIDDVPFGTIPYGGSRQDVGSAFPSFPNANDSGFSLAFNYGNLSTGEHRIRIVAVDPNEGTNESQATFSVARFPDPFIKDPQRIDLTGATAVPRSESFVLQGVRLDDERYDVTVAFRKATQNFAITNIVPRTVAVRPPIGDIAVPTGEQTLTVGESLAFAGRGSGGTAPLSYRWNFGDPAIPESLMQNTGEIRFDSPGTFTVALTVTDAEGRSDPDPPTITVQVVAPPPPGEPLFVRIISPTPLLDVRVDDVESLFAQAEDRNGNPISTGSNGSPISYRWIIDNGGLPPLTGQQSTIRLPAEVAGRKVKIEVEASDGQFTDRAAVTVVVFEPDPDEGGK